MDSNHESLVFEASAMPTVLPSNSHSLAFTKQLFML